MRLEFEYRLLIDRQEHLPTDGISTFVQGYIPNIVLERESAAELIYGIKRGESKQIERLISGLDQNKQSVGINSYGLSMTTIEDVFLRLVQEEEEHESKHHHLDDKGRIFHSILFDFFILDRFYVFSFS